MRKLIWRRLHEREEGATLVIVALCLVALIGMVVLVVDVGGLLLNRREMVNASDAAALSAAKTCAMDTSDDLYAGDQENAADSLATQNSSRANTGGQNIIDQSGCHTDKEGFVTVQYSADQKLFFAGVLGGGGSKPVTTKATAIWGPSGSGTPVPLTVYTNSFGSNCDVETLPPDSECYFWFDNSNFGSSRFGILDLRQWDGTNQSGWDVPGNTQSCGSGIGADTLSEWISGQGVAELDVNYPATTYVCIVTGTPENKVWGSLEDRKGQVLTFPINRCEETQPFVQQGGQVNASGSEVTCSTPPHKYDIIGFVDFQLEDVLTSAAEWGGTANTNCSKNNFDVKHNQTYLLTSIGGGNCPTTTPTGISNLSIDGKAPTDAGAQYTVDNPANPTLFTWTGPDGKVPVSFTWWINGKCGQPAPNSSAVCILVKTVKVRVGGGDPGGGSPLGNRQAVALCDPTIKDSCKPVLP